jgi:Thioredoxin-like
MYPLERSLVKKYQGRPFVILGVNSDKDRAQLKEVVKKEGISWRSWWDGGSLTGPIQTKWNINGWPTIYLLDHKGIIRAKELPEAALDHQIDVLAKQAEAGAGKLP